MTFTEALHLAMYRFELSSPVLGTMRRAQKSCLRSRKCQRSAEKSMATSFIENGLLYTWHRSTKFPVSSPVLAQRGAEPALMTASS